MDDAVTVRRRLLVAVDASGYSRRDDVGQFGVQRNLLGILDAAAERAGLHRDLWLRQTAGDGELSVVPESEQESVVVDDFVRELNDCLAKHNYDLAEHARLRLRLAVHHGTAYTADLGYAGQGVVEVSRLLDSQMVRSALMVSGAHLVVALSPRVYQDTVLQRHTRYTSEEFRRVEVRNKEYAGEAYLYVPGTDAHALPLGLRGAPDAPPQPRPETTATETPPSRGGDSFSVQQNNGSLSQGTNSMSTQYRWGGSGG